MATEVESLCELGEEDVKDLAGLPKRELEKKLEGPTLKLLRMKPRREMGASMKECPKGNTQIPKEYWDLWDLFSEKGSDMLPPNQATDCSREILLGAKLSKFKPFSMTSREIGLTDTD